MKYLIIILFTTMAYSQQVSIGFDLSNALDGSEVNAPGLDIVARFTSIEPWGEIGLEVEYFKTIDYFSWGMYASQVIEIGNLEFLVGPEIIQIIRGGVGVLAYGFNGEARYFHEDTGLGVGFLLNYRYRADLEVLYNDGRFVRSGFVNLIYRWR